MERPPCLLFVASYCLLLFFSSFHDHRVRLVVVAQNANASSADVGVILDLETLEGKRSWTSISLALDDFYAANSNYTTRVRLHARDSEQNNVGAASAALDLIKNVQVQAIIGSLASAQAEFVADLGNKTQVPILSFSATSSPARTPYFVRTTLNDSSQVGTIAAIINSSGWPEVIPIYEDAVYGAGITVSLLSAIQVTDARIPYCSVIPASSSDDQIKAELYKLMTMQNRVFIVHMMPALGSRLFTLAAEAGMMSEGYMWIATDSMGSTLDSLDPAVVDAMQGVLGVMPYVPKPKEPNNFRAKWMARFRQENPRIVEFAEPTVFQLWAYDTAWALALAVETAGVASSRFQKSDGGDNSTELGALGVSQTGPGLLEAILKTRFDGVSGDFQLIDGQLQSSAFEIVNVVGKGGRGVGFWTPAMGLSRQLNSIVDLKPIIYPGETTTVPKGWHIPASGKKLRIGVPMKNVFREFLHVKRDPISDEANITGYCIDVFDALIKTLPYALPYDYIHFGNDDGESSWSYDDLVYQVYLQKLDAVVGDVTITLNRTLYVDFTWSYTTPGVSMIVKEKDGSQSPWIFLKPLTAELWLGSIAFFFFTGFVVWVIEHRINEEFRGPALHHLGLIFYFGFSTLVYAHKEKLESNLSRLTVIVWVFVVLILTSSYTASLTSMLLAEQLRPAVEVTDLLKNGDYVGYQEGSSVVELLKQMLFDEDRLIALSSSDKYADALSRGSENGGVAAIFDEIPYLQLFLSEHCGEYTMSSWTYKSEGFGFAFSRGSPLVSDVSKAILKMMNSWEMEQIERKWLGNLFTCSTLKSKGLNFQRFGGLFIITGVVSLYALLIFFATFLYKEQKELKTIAAFEGSFWRRFVAWIKHYDHKDLTSRAFKRDRDVTNVEVFNHGKKVEHTAATSNSSGSQSPLSFGSPEEGISLAELCDLGIESSVAQSSIEMTETRA